MQVMRCAESLDRSNIWRTSLATQSGSEVIAMQGGTGDVLPAKVLKRAESSCCQDGRKRSGQRRYFPGLGSQRSRRPGFLLILRWRLILFSLLLVEPVPLK